MKKTHRDSAFKLYSLTHLIASVGFVLSLTVTHAAFGDDDSPDQPQQVGTVKKIEGKAWASRDQSGIRKSELHLEDPLYDGDYLFTGNQSSILVLLGEKESSIKVKQNSIMKVIQTKEKSWLIDLKQGLSLFNVNPKHIRPGFFKVKTNAAVMGARGTTFFVKAMKGEDVFLCMCNGTVSVDDDFVFTSKHHDFHTFIKAGKGKVSERMKPTGQGTDHSDNEAGDLAAVLADEPSKASKAN
ncbi:MAG: FecR domain-containing protein [Bdellovibrio sp.]|nr:FecR domain-containing protein [Bdellovibrio sp.]